MLENLIIASPSEDRVASWKQALNGFVSKTDIYDSYNVLFHDIANIKPEVLLLDFDLLGLSSWNGVAKLKILSPETRIIILSCAMSEDMEFKLMKAGVWGSCRHEISSELLKQVVIAVQQGQMWIRRMLT
jgi:two-component system NarL family response regulator